MRECETSDVHKLAGIPLTLIGDESNTSVSELPAALVLCRTLLCQTLLRQMTAAERRAICAGSIRVFGVDDWARKILWPLGWKYVLR